MNYENEYKFYYDKFYSKIERHVKLYYIEQSKKERSFGVTNNDLAKFLSNDLGKSLFLNLNDDLKELLNKFNNRYTDYRRNEINLVVENDIKPAFDKLNKDTFPKNYHLKKLLIQVAFSNAKKEISRLLQNNNRLFELFYDLNDFENFEIREYSPISLENTDLYISLDKRKHPSSYSYEPSIYVEINDDVDLNEINLKNPTLPLSITLLNEIGFFKLEKIKGFSSQQLAKLISLIQIKNPNDRNSLRSISGNIRNATGGNDNVDKYTAGSNKNINLATKLFKDIKDGE